MHNINFLKNHNKKIYPFLLGQPSSSYSRNVFIYTIGDYANFTETYYYVVDENPIPTTQASPTSSAVNQNYNDTSSIIIAVTLGSISGIMVFGLIGLVIFKRFRAKT